MMRIMVGLMGNAAFISISSSVMPMIDSRTMARSSWFHLSKRVTECFFGGERGGSTGETPHFNVSGYVAFNLWGHGKNRLDSILGIPNLSLKNLRKPNATSFSTASKTNTMVNT